MTRKYSTIQLTIDSLVTNLKGKLRDAVKFVLSNAFFFLNWNYKLPLYPRAFHTY